MKRIFSLLLISAMLLSFAACNDVIENEKSTVSIDSNEASSIGASESTADKENAVERYLAKWRDSELEVVVSDTFNDGFFIGLVPEIERPDEEQKELMKAKLEQRTNNYVKANPIDSIEYTFDGVTYVLPFDRADIRETVKTYSFKNEDINVTYDISSMTPVAMLVCREMMEATIEKNLAESNIVVSSVDEAIDFVRQYCKENMGIDDFDDFDVMFVNSSYYPPSQRYYYMNLHKIVNGIMVSYIVASVTEHFGATLIRVWDYDKETAEFYTACAEYALSDEAQAQAEAALIRTAAKDESIVEIKDIQLWNTGNAEAAEYHDKNSDSYNYVYDYCGRVEYHDEFDKTGVDLQYTYTAVMADGTEKPGCNVVTVFIPVDWAEEFGEK